MTSPLRGIHDGAVRHDKSFVIEAAQRRHRTGISRNKKWLSLK
jgi:hypothetical protein